MTSSTRWTKNSEPSSPYLTAAARDPGSQSSSAKMFENFKRTLMAGKASQIQNVDDQPIDSGSRSQYLQDDDASHPTVEEIAMGLHLSNIPHLPPHLTHLASSSYKRSARADSALLSTERRVHLHRRHSHNHNWSESLATLPRNAPPLPPPPSRSALRPSRSTQSSSSPKTSIQTLDSSSSPPSSSGPQTPTSLSPARRFSRLSRFARSIVPGSGSIKVVTNSQSNSQVSVALSEPVRKSVRFQAADGQQ